MFGHHKAKREKRRMKTEQSAFNKEKADWENNSSEREKQFNDSRKQQVAEKAAASQGIRETGRKKGREDLAQFFKDYRDQEGLDPEKKKALQFEANRGLKRSYQSANRKLLGDQSQRGIQGQGGVGYAQQMDLQQMARENQGQIDRDITKLDRDLAMKQLAAIFTGGEGEAAQSMLDNQMAEDELNLMDERKRQRGYENDFSKLFTRA